MYERILVPTDGSPGSDQVAAHAAELAATTGGELYAIHVVDRKTAAAGGGAGGPMGPTVQQAFEERGEAALEAVEAAADRHGVEATTELRTGTPHRVIVDCAEDVDADAIVMGTHGRSGLERYLLGSVAEHVIRAAPQPVLTVKLGGSAVEDSDAAERAAEDALAAEDAEIDHLREEPYRERTTWVVPVVTADGRRVNVHVDAATGETRIAHLAE